MKILGLTSSAGRQAGRYYFTTYKMSNSDINRAKTYLGGREHRRRAGIEHNNVTCVEFFGEYSNEIFNNWMSR